MSLPPLLLALGVMTALVCLWIIALPWLWRPKPATRGAGEPVFVLPESGADPKAVVKRLAKAMPERRFVAAGEATPSVGAARRALETEDMAPALLLAFRDSASLALKLAARGQARAVVLVEPKDAKTSALGAERLPPLVIVMRQRAWKAPALDAVIERIAAAEVGGRLEQRRPDILLHALERAEVLARELRDAEGVS